MFKSFTFSAISILALIANNSCNKSKSNRDSVIMGSTESIRIPFSSDSLAESLEIDESMSGNLVSKDEIDSGVKAKLAEKCRYVIKKGTYKITNYGQSIASIEGFDPVSGGLSQNLSLTTDPTNPKRSSTLIPLWKDKDSKVLMSVSVYDSAFTIFCMYSRDF